MLRDQHQMKADITPPAVSRPDAVHLRARRSPRLIGLGILAVVLGGLGAASLYSLNTNLTEVVVMTHDVVRGAEIHNNDLGVISMPAGQQLAMTAAEDLPSMVGQTALSDLPAGSFPLERHMGEQPIPPGQSLLGIRLDAGRLPTGALPPGTRIQLISLAEESPAVVEAVMASTPVLMDDGSSHILDIIVKNEFAAAVAVLAATDQLALIAVGDE